MTAVRADGAASLRLGSRCAAAGAGVLSARARAYRGSVRIGHHPGRGHQVHLVTQAHRSRSADIAYRQRRYLWMMGIRTVCFGIAVIMFINHLGWFTAIPAVAAIFLPYFAVVLANAGREPDNVRGFMEYRPKLPATRDKAEGNGSGRPAGPERGDEEA